MINISVTDINEYLHIIRDQSYSRHISYPIYRTKYLNLIYLN